MKPNVKMEDIARETGLSKMTVSRVLSNKGYVSEETRTLVLSVAKQLDYHVNYIARQFGTHRTYMLGLVTPFEGMIGSQYFGRIVEGMQQALGRSDFHLVIFDSLSEDFNDGRKCARLYHQRRVDGLIVLAPHRSDRFVKTFANLRVPLVVAGGAPSHKSISWVDVDNYGGAVAATNYLVSLGHRRIGFLCGPEDLRDAEQRKLAFRKTMTRHRLPVNERWVLQGDYGIRRAFHLALDLLAKRERPTAIFAANDQMAFGVVDAARARGLRIPEDLSVVGFDDLELAAESVPPLTTVRQPVKQVGRMAARYMLELLGDDEPPQPLHERLPTELVVRASTASPSRR